jgi:hypothetical protein
VRRGQRGQTIVVSALAFVLLIAAVGLAIDFGGATNVKRNDQNAADAAALAGAVVINQGQSLATATDRAKTSAGRNGVSPSGLTIQFLKGDGSTATVPTDVKTVRATVTETWSTYFIRLVGFPNVQISALAEVRMPKPCGFCVMDNGASPALQLSATGGVTVTGGEVQVNSNGSPAVVLDSSGSIVAPGTNVVGSVSLQSGGTISPPLATGVAKVPDPLAALPYPKGPFTNNGRVDVGDVTRTINPGLYTQWALGGAGSLNLNPGTYVIVGPPGDSVAISSSGTIRNSPACAAGQTTNCTPTGAGVTLFFTCSSYPSASCACPSTNGSDISISSGGNLQIVAPTTGTYAGVAIFFDRCNSGRIALTANGGTPVTGAIYALASPLLLSANANATLAGLVVVGTSIVSGNGGITVTYDPLNDPAQRIGSAYLQWAMPRLSK